MSGVALEPAEVLLGAGWNGLRDVVGVGDFDRDGYTDIMGVRKSDNAVLLYRGAGKSLVAGKYMAYFGNFAPLA